MTTLVIEVAPGVTKRIKAPDGLTKEQYDEVVESATAQMRASGAIPATSAAGRGRGAPPTAAEREAALQFEKSLGRGIQRVPQALLEGSVAVGADVLGMTPGFKKEAAAIRESLAKGRAGVPEMELLIGDIGAGAIPIGGTAARSAKIGRAVVRKSAEFYSRAVGNAAVEGAVVSQLPYQDQEDRVLTAAAGAVIPAVAQAVGSATSGPRNAIVRHLKLKTDPATAESLDLATKGWFDDDFNIAQATADPDVNLMARNAVNAEARDAIRGQLNDRISRVRKVADSLGADAPLLNNEDWAMAFSKVVRNEVADAKKYAGTQFRNDIARLSASPEGAALRIDTDTVRNGFQEVESRFQNPFAMARQGALGKNLQDSINTLETMKATGLDQFNMAAYRDLIEGINSARTYTTGLPPESQAGTRAFLNQLTKVVEDAADATPGNAEAVARFRQLRGEYHMRQDEIRRLYKSGVVKLFGDPAKVRSDPEAALDKFLGMRPAAQREALGWLTEANPALVGVLKKRYLDNAVDAATAHLTPKMTSRLTPAGLNKLHQAFTNPRIQASGLFSAEERATMKASASNLEIVMNSLPDTTRPGTPITPADLAINIVSRSPEFAARLVARVITGHKLGKLMFTPEGRQALSTITNLRTAEDAAYQNAMAYLTGLVAEEETDSAGR